MEDRCSKDSEVKYLMTGSTEVELAGSTSFGAPDHVDYGPLDIDVASQVKHPNRNGCDVLFHELEHNVHRGCRYTKDDVHSASHLTISGFIELRNKGDNETR